MQMVWLSEGKCHNLEKDAYFNRYCLCAASQACIVEIKQKFVLIGWRRVKEIRGGFTDVIGALFVYIVLHLSSSIF
jgi:hypothetical protein